MQAQMAEEGIKTSPSTIPRPLITRPEEIETFQIDEDWIHHAMREPSILISQHFLEVPADIFYKVAGWGANEKLGPHFEVHFANWGGGGIDGGTPVPGI